jgi:peptide/nickel transport system permease protein
VTRYLARRVGLSAIVVAGVVVLTFFITRVIPGDPAASWAGPHASPAEIAAIRHKLGLDQPVWRQIGTYFKGIVTGDWGVSVHTHQPVLSDIAHRLPASLELVVAAILIALLVGIPLGLLSARQRGRLTDHALRTVAVLGVSMPVFWLALILQLVFFRKLHVLPVAGEYDPQLQFTHPLTSYSGAPVIDAVIGGNWPVLASSLPHLVLPALAVAAYPIGVVMRMVRAGVLEVSGETHIQMVRALGFTERSVFGRFALRLTWSPVVQVLALVFAYALVNTFLVESIFDWPGIGSYAADAITSLDTPAITGITLFIAIVYVLLNLLVDLVQAALDPRIRLR